MWQEEQSNRRQAEYQVSQQAASINALQAQLQSMQSAFEELRQKYSSAEEARLAAESELARR